MLKLSQLTGDLVRTWRLHFGVQVSTLVVLTATFTIIFSIFSLVGNLRSVLSKWGKDVQVTVFLDEELPKDQLLGIEDEIGKIERFKTVRFITKEESRTKFLKEMPGFAKDLIDDPDFANPFPASFQIGGLSQPQLSKLSEIVSRISAIGGVEDVSYGQEWVENYAGFIRGITQSGIFVLLTLLLGSFLVIANSVRVGLAQRREEIEILELVGATSSAIRAPFVFEGTVMGTLAAVLALLLSYGVFFLEIKLVNSEMSFLGITEVFRFFSPTAAFGLILFGAGGGSLAAYSCVRKINTGWAASGRLSPNGVSSGGGR